MKLVEVVRGEWTGEAAVERALTFVQQLDKEPQVLPESPGFVVNRILFPMLNEAIFVVGEGVADAATVDSCMKMGLNHPMGPLELADYIGLDVCLSILETLYEETGDPKYRPAPLLKKFVRAGKLGRKSGVGFYPYKKKA
jgi:3-hydroxybutyryl-CoA dehydrogenase